MRLAMPNSKKLAGFAATVLTTQKASAIIRWDHFAFLKESLPF